MPNHQRRSWELFLVDDGNMELGGRADGSLALKGREMLPFHESGYFRRFEGSA